MPRKKGISHIRMTQKVRSGLMTDRMIIRREENRLNGN